MNTLEDRLRETLAERAQYSPIDADAWDKTVARSRRRGRPAGRLRWPGRLPASLLIPAAAAAAVVAVVVAATTLAGHVHSVGGQASNSTGPATADPSLSSGPAPAPPGQNDLVVREIPPVTPFVRMNFFADKHTVWDYLWFGYVPGYARAGIALCQVNDGGVYDGWSGCTSGRLPAGALARSAATDGSGWIRLGVTAPQVTSVMALLPGGHSASGVVKSVRGVPDKVWAVSYPVEDAATLVFRDAAGHEVTHLAMPGEQNAPSRPIHGGIVVYSYDGQQTTAYHLSDGRIVFWSGNNSTWSEVSAGEAPLAALTSSGAFWFGYAPANVSRVTMRLADGREFSTSTQPGWPGIRLWGPMVVPAQIPMAADTIVITYDAAGHVIEQVPLIFLG
jgi:hypothetical protein